MSTALTKPPASVAAALQMCEEGRDALVRAQSVAEAKDILDQVDVLEHAIKVRDLNQDAIIAASTLRIRAERRVAILAAQSLKAGRPKIVDSHDHFAPTTTLAGLGVSKDESSNYQRLAAVPEAKFEKALDEVAVAARDKSIQVTRDRVMRTADPSSSRTVDDGYREAAAFFRACDQVHQRAEPAQQAIRFGHFPGEVPQDADDVFLTSALLSLRQAREAIARVGVAVQAAVGKRRRA